MHQIHLLYPFLYTNKPEHSDGYITDDQLFEFLPYVKTFFKESHKKIIVKTIDLQSTLVLAFQNKTDRYISELKIKSCKIFFFEYNVAIFSLILNTEESISKEELSLILKHLANLTSISKAKILQVLPSKIYTAIAYDNSCQKITYGQVMVVPLSSQNKTLVKDFRVNESMTDCQNKLVLDAIEVNKNKYNALIASAPGMREWVTTTLGSYIDIFESSNFLNIAYMNLFVLSLEEKDTKEREAFVDATLLRYQYEENKTKEIVHSGIQKMSYSNTVDIYANLNGTHIFAERDTYNIETFLDHFGKNIFLIYLFVLLQKSILIKLINGADDTKKDKDGILKMDYNSIIINYMRHIDFTQLSNNPVRNNTYTFYRSTHMIKPLLDEIKVITEYYTTQKQKLDDKISESRFRKIEIFAIFIGLIFPIIELRKEIFSILKKIASFFLI